MHDFPESKTALFGKYLNRMRWVLIHNRWKLEEAKRVFPFISHSKYLYEPNAVDLKDFDIRVSFEEARRDLALPIDKKIVVYTGHLYGWKGVDTLAKCAQLLADNYLVVFVGGTDIDVKRFRDKYEKINTIKIVGHVKHSEIPIWQKAADILALPNTAKEKISAFYTSPMKLFEYMASGRPIVATDIPSIREILNENNSVIVEADDPLAMRNGLVKVGESAGLSNKLSLQALSDVSFHTWEKRAERIIDFIGV
jgi:glycosyltransferase involved in cell wall biosynthesis